MRSLTNDLLTMLKKTLQGIFVILFGLIGVTVLLYGTWLFMRGMQSTAWPSAPGKILFSGYSESRGSGPTTYGAKVTYEYSVNQRRFTSDRVSFGNYSSSNSEHARQIISRYPPGKEVLVYYEPGEPEVSVLEQGVAGGAYLGLILGAAFLGFSLFVRWASKQNSLMNSPERIDANKDSVSFQGKETSAPDSEKGSKRVSRDVARVNTSYPPYAIVMGVIFLIAGLSLAYFGKVKSIDPLIILLGAFISVAGGTLAWYSTKGLRLRNLRRQTPGRGLWQYDYPWNRQGTGDHALGGAVRVFYAIAMMSLFVTILQILLLKNAQLPGARLFIYFVTGLFDLILIAGFGRSVFLFIRALKFGKNRVLFHSFPLSVGQDVTVTFAAGRPLFNLAMHAELQCISEYYEGSNRGNSQSSVPVFELIYSQACDFHTGVNGKAELTFHVPENAVSTDLLGFPPYYWELEISAKVPGVDYRGIFLMPVYKTA